MDFDRLLAEVKQRDYNDSHRAAAPLKQAEDAVLVDTTGLTKDESIQKIFDLVQAKL